MPKGQTTRPYNATEKKHVRLRKDTNMKAGQTLREEKEIRRVEGMFAEKNGNEAVGKYVQQTRSRAADEEARQRKMLDKLYPSMKK